VHGCEVRTTGRAPDGPAVLVANHLGWIDPIVLAAAHPVAPIAKLEVEGWPLVGEVGRRHGVLFIARGDAHRGARVLRAGLAALRAGVCVLNFPEGTTTDGSALLPFRRGSFGLARLARVPVVPVALALSPAELCWTGDDAFLPHYLRTAARARLGAHVRFGAPLDAGGARAEVVAAEARAAITRMLADTSI
jgi:1-acyl-sn-glycerol-3-phosphate acyltransferase